MTGLNHNCADVETRELFALTNDKACDVLASLVADGGIGGCVILSTCNRTELYASVPDAKRYEATAKLCGAIGRDYFAYRHYFSERTNRNVIEHLCKVASGIDSRIIGDDQIITQTRDALELSRSRSCTDSYIETMFKISIQAAKSIKTNVILKTLGIDSVPGKTVEKLSGLCSLPGRRAVVIGNGQIGRLVAERLLRESMIVTMTLREYKKGVIVVPEGAETISYSERYDAISRADIVVSATSSPHFTLTQCELAKLPRCPGIFADLAVPRDIEPSIGSLPGVVLLAIDDIASESRDIPEESSEKINKIIIEHISKYDKWREYKEGVRC